jgi:HAE1 family hydrophobic/amphiphilic exporter-1/multidrug efflux pump
MGHGWFYRKTEPFFEGMENGYKRLLTGFMKIRWMAWVIVIICVGIIWLTFTNLQSEIAPLEDRSSIRFTVTAPEGTSYNYMQNVADNIADYLYDSVPERDFVFARTPANAGTNSSQPRIGLIAPDLRQRSQNDIANDLQKKLSRFNDARIFAIQEQTISVGLGSRASLPVQFVVENMDFDKLKKMFQSFWRKQGKIQRLQTLMSI